MIQTDALQQLIAKKINGFCEKNGDGTLFQPINYIMQLGGKRIRPMLTLMSANLFTDELEDVIYPALAMEVFHNFTLMHDDIMDDSPIRRGKPTVHQKWDNNKAILSGDTMLVQSYKLLIKTRQDKLSEVIRLFNKTAIEVCEGQQKDMDFEELTNVGMDEYLEMIRLKTSVLAGCAMMLGAIIAGADEMAQDKLYTFGESLGMAFQLHDDYLDVFGEKETTGKQTGGDIISNKKTFLLIRAFEKAQKEDLEILHRYIGNQTHNNEEKVRVIKDVYQKLGVEKDILLEASKFFDSAMSALEQVKVEDSRKEVIKRFAQKLQTRQS